MLLINHTQGSQAEPQLEEKGGIELSVQMCTTITCSSQGAKSEAESIHVLREEQMARICLCVHVCVAPPMIVGAWSTAVMLW